MHGIWPHSLRGHDLSKTHLYPLGTDELDVDQGLRCSGGGGANELAGNRTDVRLWSFRSQRFTTVALAPDVAGPFNGYNVAARGAGRGAG